MGYPKKILASNTYDPNFGPVRSVAEQPIDGFSYERMLLEHDPLALARKTILQLSQAEVFASFIPYTPAEGYVIPAENSVEYNHTIPVPFSLANVEAVLIGKAMSAGAGPIPRQTEIIQCVVWTLGTFKTVRPFVIAFEDYKKTIGQVGNDLVQGGPFNYVNLATYADFFGRHGLDKLLPQYAGVSESDISFPLQDIGVNTYSSIRTVWIDKEQNALVFRYKKLTAQGGTVPSTFEIPIFPIF